MYHVETFIGKGAGLVPRGAEYTTALLMLFCRLMYLLDCFLQIFVHSVVQYWMSDIITKIIRADEKDVNSWNLGYFVNLYTDISFSQQ